MGFKSHTEIPQGMLLGYPWKNPWDPSSASRVLPCCYGGGSDLTQRGCLYLLSQELGLEQHCDSCYILQKKFKALPNSFGKRQLSSTPCLAVDAEAVPLARAETKSSGSPSLRSAGQRCCGTSMGLFWSPGSLVLYCHFVFPILEWKSNQTKL